MRRAENLPLYCAVVKKSRSLNFLDPSGPPMACYGSALPLPLYHRCHDFRGKVSEHKMCVLIVSINSVSNIAHSKRNSAPYDYQDRDCVYNATLRCLFVPTVGVEKQ